MGLAPAARASHRPGDAAPVVDEAGVPGAGDVGSHVIVRASRDHPRPGEVVKVKADTAHLHLFDGATGLRVGE